MKELLRDLRPVAVEAGYYCLAARIDAALSQQAEPDASLRLLDERLNQIPKNELLAKLDSHPQAGPTIGEMLAQLEPAPAQDEREAVLVVGYAYNLESGVYSQYPGEDWSALMTIAQHERIVAALTRPAQTEQQPEQGLEEWAKGKFHNASGRFTGQLYGNTDWALARLVWSAAMKYRAALSATPSHATVPNNE